MLFERREVFATIRPRPSPLLPALAALDEVQRWADARDEVQKTLSVVDILARLEEVRRGRRELDGAKLLDGHPEEEVEAAFLAARLDHMALPYSKTWLRLLFS